MLIETRELPLSHITNNELRVCHTVS